MTPQPGILDDLPAFGRYLWLRRHHPDATAVRACLRQLAAWADGQRAVVGLGEALVRGLGARIPGLHVLPALVGPGVSVPSTPADLCLWLRGQAPGDAIQASAEVLPLLAPAFELTWAQDGFRHGHGLDLTGYEDGTENPPIDEAPAVALVQGVGAGLDGSSFMSVQLWRHNLAGFHAMPALQRDHTIGRRISDNAELADAPPSAHVQRAAQESFDPEAFMVRRSMPWACGVEAGLVFVAFGRSLDAFEAILRRMVGLEDGITDALFTFTQPQSGAHFWCPPMRDGRLDLQALG
jgi:putative iron-dependent peroxidase